MSRKLRIQTLIYSLLFSVASMAGMLYYSANKMIVIADVAQDSVDTESDVTQEDIAVSEKVESTQRLKMQESKESTNYLCVPLPKGFKAEQVQIENHYMEKQLRVFLLDAPQKFFADKEVSGNLDAVEDGMSEDTRTGIRLTFELNDIYECRSILENDYLYIEFVHPREIYDRIVVIDVGHGGEDKGYCTETVAEKDITLDIAQKLKEKLDTADIKVYYTRMDDRNYPEDDRVYLANVVKADMFISIHANYDEDDRSTYGIKTLYNPAFFIPGFGSVELSDTLEREVVTGINGKGLGIFTAEEDCYILQNASVPATILQVGYLSNKQETILLEREDYRQRIADGIYNAILKVYEEKK